MTTRQLLQISELAEQLGVAERFIRFDPTAVDDWIGERRVPSL